MSEEIPIWVNGMIQWVSGVDRKTTCKDVIEAVLIGIGNSSHNAKDYTIMERWRRVERPLDENSKILKIWSHWGDEKKEVRLWIKRINGENDSGRGSPIEAGNGSAWALKKRRHHRSRGSGKPPWFNNQDTIHPKRLAKLGDFNDGERGERGETRNLKPMELFDNVKEYDRTCSDRKADENASLRKKPGHRSYQCSGTGVLHSTLLSPDEDDYCKPTTSKCCSKKQSKSKIRNSENIEKLMKLILAQGATIQSQLRKLKEREEQIESMEDERHRERIEKNGRNYLLETYLGSLNEAEIPAVEDGNEPGDGRKGEQSSDEALTISKRTERSKLADSYLTGTLCKTLQESRSKRSRSESRGGDDKSGEKQIKRTLSFNNLTSVSDGENCSNEGESDTRRELKKIQTQMEIWEQVFEINKKLEKEEENLVRLHVNIKRFQAESCKGLNEDGVTAEESGTMHDRLSVQNNLEIIRRDLDENSKEIYQNFTKLKENDEAVKQKRTVLNRLIHDLYETEQEYILLSQMYVSLSEDKDEGSTSFMEKEEEEEEDEAEEEMLIVQRMTDENALPHTLKQSSDYNQRKDNFPGEEENIKPKIVKISFDEDIVKSSSERSTGTIKGILKNSNSYENQQRCDVKVPNYDSNSNIERERTRSDNILRATSDGYPLFPYSDNSIYTSNPAYLETHNYALQNPVAHSTKNIYSAPGEGSPHQSVMNKKKNIHNDTDSNTSSDTSGMCSMYSSSPTAEEPYTESNYVLDTLV